MAFTLNTLGNCQLTDQQGKLVRAPLIALHILAYLHENGPQISRRDLALIFWPGHPEAAATNLRSTLLRLSKATVHAPAPLIISEGSTLSLNHEVVVCDLGRGRQGDPLARLRASCDAVARQFFPAEAALSTPFAGWVRQVRRQLLAELRALLLTIAASPQAPEVRGDLHRAVVMILEQDPHDEEVRRHLSARNPAASAVILAEQPLQFRPEARPSVHSFPLVAPQTDLAAITPPRVALLPPETSGAAQKAGSIANALIEDLTIDLCASRSVSVVAPYTSEQIRASKDKAALLERHRVIYALDTQRHGDTLFVQLIFMPTDEVVWARRFDLDARSVNTQRVQMADAIKGNVTQLVRDQASLADHFTDKPEAYFAYLRGIQSLSGITLPSVRKARRHFREALDHDKAFGMALAGVSRTLTLEWVLMARGDKQLLLQAENLALLAMDGNQQLSSAYKELGVSQLYLGKIDESVEALHTAEALSPHYADVLLSHSDSLVHASKPDLALAKIKQAMDLNPATPDTYLWTAAGASFFLHAYDEALSYLQRMRDSRSADRLAAACWAMLGETQRARRCRNRVLEDNPDFDLERWLSFIPIKEKWQRDLYHESLTKAGF
ncbi:hypothetical protein [Rhizobium sp. SSA_523]|uniref:hypothetical protein n=1 Tax=Rhizobium sp. SSA_523 TaxID=2952477 RepID=UPI002091A60A|nr:hypothetical protein [Rhizobium sp. SSA_523]MCO5732378.1 hypothetical protein [Rhizobium sp. SSA_523]WKC21227.1 hypothetical protein QTJ18_04875 [Rhizobium sp. SSA_523]